MSSIDVDDLKNYTPLFRALNDPRYSRRDFIVEIEQRLDCELIVYVGFQIPIIPDDIAPFQDLLYKINYESRIALLIYSNGGVIDAAEKLSKMVRNVTKEKEFIVIVPEKAKSAATLLALTSDKILMGDTSELGPIDPQVPIYTRNGVIYRPAFSILDTIRKIEAEGKLNPAYIPMLDNLDLSVIDIAEKAVKRTKKCADDWLSKYMLKNNKVKAKEIAKKLSDDKKWLSHGYAIDHKDAKVMGLNIEYYAKDNPTWELIWRLYVSYLPLRGQFGKVFESKHSFLPVPIQ
jgi:hypothetical protein